MLVRGDLDNGQGHSAGCRSCRVGAGLVRVWCRPGQSGPCPGSAVPAPGIGRSQACWQPSPPASPGRRAGPDGSAIPVGPRRSARRSGRGPASESLDAARADGGLHRGRRRTIAGGGGLARPGPGQGIVGVNPHGRGLRPGEGDATVVLVAVRRGGARRGRIGAACGGDSPSSQRPRITCPH